MMGNWGRMVGDWGGMMGYWGWVMGNRGGMMRDWGGMVGYRARVMGHRGGMMSWVMWLRWILCLGMMNGINMMCKGRNCMDRIDNLINRV